MSGDGDGWDDDDGWGEGDFGDVIPPDGEEEGKPKPSLDQDKPTDVAKGDQPAEEPHLIEGLGGGGAAEQTEKEGDGDDDGWGDGWGDEDLEVPQPATPPGQTKQVQNSSFLIMFIERYRKSIRYITFAFFQAPCTNKLTTLGSKTECAFHHPFREL